MVDIANIEYAEVQDDPRQWSAKRKRTTLAMVATAAMIATLGANIYNPAIQQIMDQLHANDAEIALSLSLYIIVQGAVPTLWAAISEVKGRKTVYLSSVTIYAIACVICGLATHIGLLIAMRLLQAFGGAAVITIGAGTLADIYDPQDRGTALGIYYAAPLLGPALGPLFGGILTQAWSWRATFYFLAVLASIVLASFVFFKDTFRRERSISYQAAVLRARQRDTKHDDTHHTETVTSETQVEEKKTDIEAATGPEIQEIKLTFGDVNPFPQLKMVLKRKNNVAMYFPSGLLFALSYSITYTCSKTLFAAPYNYSAFRVGLVTLSFGVGSMVGSIVGGRWSDRKLAQLKLANGGVSTPEMRLESIKLCMPILPLSVLAYAWVADQHAHVAALVVALFFVGFGSLWVYSSTLAYVVDANVGRSSTAVATNSFARGAAGFIAAEAAVPLQVAIGDGGLYTIWAILCVILELTILMMIKKGKKWREEAVEKERVGMEEGN